MSTLIAPKTPDLIAKLTRQLFNLLPITYNEASGLIETTDGYSDPGLNHELKHINDLHKVFLETNWDLPPNPFISLDLERTAQIRTACDLGTVALTDGKFNEAVAFYTEALKLARDRAVWESSVVLQDQLHELYKNRSQAHICLENWPEALADAQASIDFNNVNNVKAYLWKATCLQKMGKLEGAMDVLILASQFGNHHSSDKAYVEMWNTITRLIKERDIQDAS